MEERRPQVITRLVGCLLLAVIVIGAGVSQAPARELKLGPPYFLHGVDTTTVDGSSDTLKAPLGWLWTRFELTHTGATADAQVILQFVKNGTDATSDQLVTVNMNQDHKTGVTTSEYYRMWQPRRWEVANSKIVIDNTKGSWQWEAFGNRAGAADGCSTITVADYK